jgi:hypothetical protein
MSFVLKRFDNAEHMMRRHALPALTAEGFGALRALPEEPIPKKKRAFIAVRCEV